MIILAINFRALYYCLLPLETKENQLWNIIGQKIIRSGT